MKILLALHGSSQGNIEEICIMQANRKKNTVTKNESEYKVESIVKLLDKEHPHKVLMDLNYGSSGGFDHTPFRTIQEAMKARNYDVRTALMGISGRNDLVADIKGLYEAQVVDKTDIVTKIFPFLS